MPAVKLEIFFMSYVWNLLKVCNKDTAVLSFVSFFLSFVNFAQNSHIDVVFIVFLKTKEKMMTTSHDVMKWKTWQKSVIKEKYS